MAGPATLYGWHLSYYTGKVRSYLLHKQIPFTDQPVDLLTLGWRIKRRTGAVVMPVLVTPQGEWLQDSSAIIDQMEARFPARAVLPATPVQRFASLLWEAWADEWWVPIAMHTRWSYAENYALFEREAGAHLLPGWPAWLQRKAVARVAGNLRGYLPAVGVRPAQFALMEDWTRQVMGLLDAHLARHAFLLGGLPSLADFALMGPMYAHLGRDPWPARELVAAHPHLRAWIDRLARSEAPGDTPPGAAWLAGDAVPDTLAPVFALICAEFLPLLVAINTQVKACLPSLAPGKPLPRALGDVTVPMGQGQFSRAAIPYTLWMAQRCLDAYRAMDTAGQQAVQRWLATVGGEGLLSLDIPRLQRQGLQVVVQAGPA